jgi:hypothetical protein
LQNSDLEDRHRGDIPAALAVKNDTTRDLLTIFSDHVFVNVEVKKKLTKTKGRWCLICRSARQLIWQAAFLRTTRANFKANKTITNEKKAFFVGGNSSCRAHIRQHYDIYKERCKAGNIPENHHAIPRHIFRQMKVDKKTTGGVQSTLDGVVGKSAHLKSYTREAVLHAVAQFVACDDQVREMLMLRAETDFL